MPMFRKKPVTVEAREFTDQSRLDVAAWCGGYLFKRRPHEEQDRSVRCWTARSPMTDIVTRIKSGWANRSPFPFPRVDPPMSVVPIYAVREHDLRALVTKIDQTDDALRDTTASLVAAISLLERGGKKAAPSNMMFDIMLDDYRKSVERARALLNRGPDV